MTPARFPRGLAWAVLALCAWAWISPLGIASDDPYRDNDWFTDRAFDVLAREAWLGGELPLRSHRVGGGFPTIGHPFDGAFSPTILPVLAFGDVLGVKVVLAVLWLLGAWGMWGLARGWAALSAPASAVATLAFAWAGWVPSMLLVGFYPQCFYLLVPAILRLLWVDAGPAAPSPAADLGRPATLLALLGAGALLTLLLLQAGNALLAVGVFLAFATWVRVGAEQPGGMVERFVLPLLLGLLVTAPQTFARELGGPAPLLLGWGAAGALVLGLPWGRRFVRALMPWAARGAVILAVVASLGAFKLAALGDLLERGSYEHDLGYGWELWFPRDDNGARDGRIARSPWWTVEDPRPPGRDSDFWNGLPELLEGLAFAVPRVGEYDAFEPDPAGLPVEARPPGVARREYLWVGLTPPVLLLAIAGLVRGRRRGELAVLAALVAGVGLGPHLLPDLHFLLVRGLPGCDRIVQPVKYFGFFLVPVLALAAGAGFEPFERRLGRRWPVAATALLAWAFVQSGARLAWRFDEPVRVERAPRFEQLASIGDPSWVGLPQQDIAEWRGRHLLRELARPPAAREYQAAKAGLGVIDWYGTVTLPEAALPARYLTPSGASFANPDYPGDEVSVARGQVLDWSFSPTRLRATVRIDAATSVVFNQNFDSGWVSGDGAVQDDDGRLAVGLSEPGQHVITLRYQPPVRGWLLLSLLAAAGWSALALRLRRR